MVSEITKKEMIEHLEFLGSSGIQCKYDPCPFCNAIRRTIEERDKLYKSIEADQRAIMAAENLAIKFIELNKKMRELKELADKILMATGKCDDCPLLEEIRDFGKEGK